MATKLTGEFLKGVWDENPGLKQLLGLCPTLAVTNSAENGLAMGIATTFVLFTSASVISTFRKYIPDQVRIASFIVIIATFVTMADKFIAAFYPSISKALGPYIPLIIVNCIILGRAEAFSSKNNLMNSLADALGMGMGVILVLVTLGSIREILGEGTIFSMDISAENGSGHSLLSPWKVMIMPPGAFFAFGGLIGIYNMINSWRKK